MIDNKKRELEQMEESVGTRNAEQELELATAELRKVSEAYLKIIMEQTNITNELVKSTIEYAQLEKEMIAQESKVQQNCIGLENLASVAHRRKKFSITAYSESRLRGSQEKSKKILAGGH